MHMPKELTMKKSIFFLTMIMLMSLTLFAGAADQTCIEGDVDGDCKMGMAEAITALKAVAGLIQTPEYPTKDVENVTNFNTRALSEAQNDVASLEQFASVLATIPLPESQPQKRNQTQSIFDFLSQANISCADISQDENSVIISFNESPLCLGMQGSIRISVVENEYVLEFSNVAKDNCPIDGKVRLSISHDSENIFADLTFEEMSINDQPIDGDYTISFNKISGILSSVDFKEKIKSYVIDGTDVQTKFKAFYDQLTGFSGMSAMTLNGQEYTSQFINFFTDPMNGLPTNGSMNINDIKLMFKQQFSKDNPVISYLVNDVPVDLKLTANKIQQGAKDFAQKITNFSTSLISGSHEEVVFIKRLTEIFSEMNLSTLIDNLKQTQSRSNNNLELIIQNIDFSACGDLSVEMNESIAIVYNFNGMPECDNITGTIKVIPSIADQNLTLLFDDLLINKCLVNGKTIITLTSELTLIHANITFEDMSVCGIMINNSYDITYDRLTGNLVSAQTKKIIEALFRNMNLQIPSTINYDAENGLNGFVTIPIMGKSYTCNFNAVNIEEKCGLPISGSLQINEFEVNFDELSCDNRTINGILDGINIKIDMVTNRISDAYKDILGKMNQLATVIVSKHGMDVEMLQQLMEEPALKDIFKPEALNLPQLISSFSDGDFTCGKAKIKPLELSIGYTFDGSCNGVTGTINLALVQNKLQVSFDTLSFGNGDCTIDGDMQININVENATIKFTQTTNNLQICQHTLDGTLEVINGLNTPVIINRKGTDTLVINGEEYAVSSDISYTQNTGLNGSVAFTKDGQAYYCKIENVKLDLTCGIPTSGTMTIDLVTIDFSETTCENLEVNVIIFGQTIKMRLDQILELLKNL
jgi:uncharacterized glyoxalase superfamily protein PhnB